MGKKCCVKDCDTTDKSPVTLFSVPKKDEQLFSKWSSVVALTGVLLKKTSFICEKHFEKTQIMDEKIIKDSSGKILFQRQLQRKTLHKGAVPSIFNNQLILRKTSSDVNENGTEGQNKDWFMQNVKQEMEIKKSDTNDVGHVDLQNVTDCNLRGGSDRDESERSDSCGITITANSVEDCSTSTTFIYPHVDNVEERSNVQRKDYTNTNINIAQSPSETDKSIFRALFHGSMSLQLPNKSWSSSSQNSPDKILFHEAGKILKPQEIPWFKKQIVLNDNLDVEVFVFNKFLKKWENLHTLQDVQDVINQVGALIVCEGGPTVSTYKNVTPRCAYKDGSNHWRHNLCPLSVSVGKICHRCGNLDNTLRQHLRIKKQTSKSHIPVSPSSRKKIEILRKALYKQAHTVKRQARQIKEVKKKAESLQDEMANLETRSLDNFLENSTLPEAQKLLIRECVSVSKRNKASGRRYTREWLLLCLLLRIRSPSAYNFLRTNSILPLPCRSTIQKYLSNVDMKSGFDQEFFKCFKEKMESLPEMSRHGVLLFDEMLIRKSISVNTKAFTFEGLDNTCDNENKSLLNDMADHALVFMFSSVGGNFHQPVATFASKNATSGTNLAQLVLQAILEIEHAGGHVDGLICDGGSNNKKMWTEFGVTGCSQRVCHYIQNPADDEKKIYFFSDTPHLIKCVRNRLLKQDLKVNNEMVSWKFYERLYWEDTKNQACLRVCPKLTVNHIYPSDTMKMRVFLATQIFSNSVADGLRFYKKRLPLIFQHSDGTINFTKRINDLFDCLNRKYPAEGVRLNGRDLKVLQETLQWLNDWERQVREGNIGKTEFLTQTTADGLRVTINSTIDLCNELLNQHGFKYILTAKLNQDHLEQFFGIIRQSGGQNDHPTLVTFLQLYKLLSLYKLIKPPKFGNCRIQDSTAIPEMSTEKLDIIFKSQPQSQKNKHLNKLIQQLQNMVTTSAHECEDIFPIEHNYTSGKIVDCIIFYVCGFLCRKMRNLTHCEICKMAFDSCSKNMNLPEAELVNTKNCGGLIYVNSYSYDLLQTAETYFAHHIIEGKNNIYEATMQDMIRNYKFAFPCEEHKEEIIAQCLHYYVLMRMRQWAKTFTNDVEKRSREKKKQAKLMVA